MTYMALSWHLACLFKQGIMNGTTALMGKAVALTFGVMLWAPGLALAASEASITRTTWSERWITNVIEVTIPTNRFVNLYHTNWTPRTMTNSVTVEAFWTNVVNAYQTNWTTKTRTNVVAVNAARTNFFTRYRTNWSTLNLTNWETVVMLRTNWVTVPVTNVVRIDIPANPPASTAAPGKVIAPKPALVEPASPAPAWSGPLTIEAVRTARAPANNMVEVAMKVRRTDNVAASVQVQQWRVEREDNAVLFVGQEQEFKRQLLVGKYKVEARLRAAPGALPTSVRGTLSVTPQHVVIQPRLLVKK